jgi:hypothetical protein
MFYPSIAAHIVQGLLLLVSIVAIALNVKALDAYRGLVILLLVTICVGVHGISHLGLEKEYRFMVWGECPHMKGECPCMRSK